MQASKENPNNFSCALDWLLKAAETVLLSYVLLVDGKGKKHGSCCGC